MIQAAANQANQSLFVAQAAGMTVKPTVGIKNVNTNQMHRQFAAAGRTFNGVNVAR